MAPLASAQLVSAITANQTVFNIQSVVTPTGAAGFPAVGVYQTPQLPIIIDQEVMYVVLQPVSGTLNVRSRGAEGTSAQPHDALSNVYIGSAFDVGLPAIGSSGYFDPNLPFVESIGSATFTIPIPPFVPGSITFNINTTSAAAITLPAPLLSQNGTVYAFVANTGFSHVVTATNVFQSGVGGQPKSAATFGGIVGSNFAVVAENGFWTVTDVTGVTVA